MQGLYNSDGFSIVGFLLSPDKILDILHVMGQVREGQILWFSERDI